VPRDVASRAAKAGGATRAAGSADFKRGVYLDFADAIGRLGEDAIADRYGNLFDMYQRITGDNPYEVPMRIYPAPHYTMGGLWVDYNLMSTIPACSRHRRGQLLRPRRQPPQRCQRPDAGRWRTATS
jgi:succinate dehydrogenase / fumarate reductase flavoprotein subunit